MSLNTNEAVSWLETTPFEQLMVEIQSGGRDGELRAVFGGALAEELRALATPQGATMRGGPIVVLLPGIMGSTLHNTVGETGLIWVDIPAILGGKLRLLTLAEDASPLVPGSRVAPLDLMASAYLPMRVQLRWAGCQVEAFPYDWRYTPAEAAERLRAFVSDLYAREGRSVHLVGHSMGGLVAREYCQRYADEAQQMVEQVITLGTPYAGSVDTVVNLTTGGGLVRLVKRVTRSDEVLRFARSIPGLYALLPAPPEGYASAAELPYPFIDSFDWYDASGYRIDSISARHLSQARAAASRRPTELPVPVTAIAGIGVPTLHGVDLRFGADEQPTIVADRYLDNDGDGTVTLASATAMPGAAPYFVREGRHGDLPLYPNVRRAVQLLVFGDTADLPQSFERGMMGAPGDAEQALVPATPLDSSCTDAVLDAMAARIEAGQASPEELALLTRGW